jgi:hypothetical protein
LREAFLGGRNNRRTHLALRESVEEGDIPRPSSYARRAASSLAGTFFVENYSAAARSTTKHTKALRSPSSCARRALACIAGYHADACRSPDFCADPSVRMQTTCKLSGGHA